MKPFVQTYSVLVGTTACNAKCPFCISQMTPKCGMGNKAEDLNVRNLKKGGLIAKEYGATTALITGKGEPTLYPEQVTQAIKVLDEDCNFQLIELQTNGINLADEKFDSYLTEWYELGLTTIAVSACHWNMNNNKDIYGKKYPYLPTLIQKLHKFGFSVRIAAMYVKGFIDNEYALGTMINFCKTYDVEQFTIRNINFPDKSENEDVKNWTMRNRLDEETETSLNEWVIKNGTKLATLVHGAEVYDVKGQNVCLSSCLTHDSESNQIRQLIYFPDGHIRYDWQFKGAILI